jgi:hypothetical protein
MPKKFRHQDISMPGSGTRVRTIHAGAHELRIAFPKGARKKGSGKIVSILHPKSEKNPACGATLTVAEVAALEIPVASLPEFGPAFEGVLDPDAAGQNPIDWKGKWDALRAKVAGFIAPHHKGTEAQSNPNVRPYRVIVFGDGKKHTWYRFAVDDKQASETADAAAKREWPSDGKVLSVKAKGKNKRNADKKTYAIIERKLLGGERQIRIQEIPAYKKYVPAEGEKIYADGFSSREAAETSWRTRFAGIRRNAKRNYTEEVKTSDGKTVFIDVLQSGGRWMAQGYPVIAGKIKRVGKPKVAYGDTESRAYDNLVMKLEPNPAKANPDPDGILTPEDVKDLRKMKIKLGRLSQMSVPRKRHIKEVLEKMKAANANPVDENSAVVQYRDKRGGYWTIRAIANYGSSRTPLGRRVAGAVQWKEEKFVNSWDVWSTPQLGSPLKEIHELVVKPRDANTPTQAIKIGKENAELEAKKLPKSNPKRKGKRNLDEIAEAAKLAGEFRGTPAKKVLELSEPSKFRDDYAHLGWLVQIVFQPPYDEGLADPSDLSDFYNKSYERIGDTAEAWTKTAQKFGIVLLVFDFEGDEIRVCCTADRKQLYLVGGNQPAFADQLNLFKSDKNHDLVDLGNIVSLSYMAQKEQAGDKEPRPYYHVFGEESGSFPKGAYDTLNKRIRLVGGTYHLKDAAAGIIN